jgi:hypothetical protein
MSTILAKIPSKGAEFRGVQSSGKYGSIEDKYQYARKYSTRYEYALLLLEII